MLIKNIGSNDAKLLQSMAAQNPPLDIHTQYTYWVLCSLFSEACFLLLNNEKLVGYITSIWNDERLLIWQIAVSEEERKKGYSQLLINAVAAVAKLKGLDMAVTISKENEASYRTFNRYCVNHGIKMYEAGRVDFEEGHQHGVDLSERIYYMDFN